jgi:hypothetical protein
MREHAPDPPPGEVAPRRRGRPKGRTGAKPYTPRVPYVSALFGPPPPEILAIEPAPPDARERDRSFWRFEFGG